MARAHSLLTFDVNDRPRISDMSALTLTRWAGVGSYHKRYIIGRFDVNPFETALC